MSRALTPGESVALSRLFDEVTDRVQKIVDAREAALEHERDYWKRIAENHGSCVCNTGPGTDGPEEFCPQHGRPYTDLLGYLSEMNGTLSRVRAVAGELAESPLLLHKRAAEKIEAALNPEEKEATMALRSDG